MATEVARYNYVDPETGEILAVKVRYEPKTFVWETTGDDGVNERDLPLYGAHLLNSKQATSAIFFVEGEKAADALHKQMNVSVVCLPGGAGTRPTTKQLSALRDKIVVLWPDNDAPGRALMRRIYEKLQKVIGNGKIRCVYPADVPGKGDPYDWLQLGHTKEDLRAEYERNPVEVLLGKQISVINLSGREAQEIDWLLRPYIPRKMMTLFEGPKGTGKTWLTLKLAAMVSTGNFDFPVNPYKTEPAKALFLAHEDPIDEVLVPRLLSMGANMNNVRVISSVVDSETGEEEWFDLKKHVELLYNLLLQDRYSLLVIDPINNYINQSVDTYRDSDIRAVLSPIAKMAEETGISVIGIRHFKKAGASLSEMGLGSVGYANIARVVHAIVPDADDILIESLQENGGALPTNGRSTVMLPVVLNIAESPRPVGFKVVIDGIRARFEWNGTRDYTAEEYVEAIKKKKSISSTRHERKLVELEEFVSDPATNVLSDADVAERFGVPPGLVELTRYRQTTGKSRF